MTRRRTHTWLRIYVLLICSAWLGVLIAALWGLDWRWIPTALGAAVFLLIAGGMVENHQHETAQRRQLAKALDEAKKNPARWITDQLGAHPGANR